MRTIVDTKNAESSSQPKPVQAVSVAEKPKMDPSKMQIVPAYPPSIPFELPDGWIVEVRPRANTNTSHSDRYYYEPESGRKFRSLVSVKRYLNGEEEPLPWRRQSNALVPYQGSGTLRRIVYGGKVLTPEELEAARNMKLEDIYPDTSQFKASTTLPDGWIVEQVPRRCGTRSDRYFIDPVTGQKFRSIPELQRFLGAQQFKPKRKALTLIKHSAASQSAPPQKKRSSKKTFKDTLLDPSDPPEKINWVYSGDGKDTWSPLVEECMLPNYVKEQWSETFMLGMNERKHRVPQLTMGETNLTSNA